MYNYLMDKKTLVAISTAAVLLAVLGVLFFIFQFNQQNQENKNYVSFDPLNASYIIENEPVTLINGKSELEAAPGSAMKITTMVFGQPVSGDLNADGRPDAALIIFQNPGGTGTFYYAAAAINTLNGAIGTNGIFLGDRIAPQNIELRNGQIIANYADRKPDEPFSAQPSVGVSKYIILNGLELEEIKSQ